MASPPGSKRYKHTTVCVCCMCICIQYHKYVHVGQPSVPLGDSAGSKLTNFCSPARLFSLSLPSLLTPSVFHSLAHSYSLSLSLLASTDRFHNHFSEVAASSAVVTQPLRLLSQLYILSLSHTHTESMHAYSHYHSKYYTMLHKERCLKETVCISLPVATTCYGLCF